MKGLKWSHQTKKNRQTNHPYPLLCHEKGTEKDLLQTHIFKTSTYSSLSLKFVELFNNEQ